MLVASALPALTVGVGAARPDRLLMRAVGGPAPGGVLARRLIPLLVPVPFLAAGLTSVGQRTGRWSGLVGTATGLLVVAILGVAVGGVGRTLNRTDREHRLLVEELRRENDFVQVLRSSLPTGVVITDPRSVIVDVNPYWCERTGFRRDEIIGQAPPYPWWPPEAPAADSGFDSLLRDGSPADGEFVLRRADGATMTVVVSIATVRDEAGGARARVVSYSDVTARKEAETAVRDQRDFQRALVDAQLNALGVVDTAGRVIEVNPALSTLTGFSRGELLGTTLPFPWFPADVAEQYVEAIRGGLESGVSVQQELGLRRADGTRFTALVSTTPVSDAVTHQPGAFVCAMVDVTDRRRIEAALAAHTVELQRANQELAEASRLNTDIIAMLSHDINQPLSVIAGYSDLLGSQWELLSESDRRAYTGLVADAGRNLSDLVANILLMFRLEAIPGPGPAVPVAVRDVVRRAVDAVRTVERPDAVEMRVEDEVAVRADPAYLRQALVNLLTNAVKYGRPPVQVAVDRAGGTVRIRVRDEGPGVPPEFVPHLFDRFTRAEGTTVPGTGLGLFIVDKLVRANGGVVRYEANRPTGSCFVIEFPRADLPVSAPVAGLDEASRGRPSG